MQTWDAWYFQLRFQCRFRSLANSNHWLKLIVTNRSGRSCLALGRHDCRRCLGRILHSLRAWWPFFIIIYIIIFWGGNRSGWLHVPPPPPPPPPTRVVCPSDAPTFNIPTGVLCCIISLRRLPSLSCFAWPTCSSSAKQECISISGCSCS